jgi:hypothetical protein
MMNQTRTGSKRKSGGQPGNLNAYKHGFYSQRFKTMELADLSTALQDNLEDEIALLRILMRRVFEYADAAADSLEEWEHALSTLGSAASRLAGLLRTQQAITGKNKDVVGMLSEAIGEVAHELGINKS